LIKLQILTERTNIFMHSNTKAQKRHSNTQVHDARFDYNFKQNNAWRTSSI